MSPIASALTPSTLLGDELVETQPSKASSAVSGPTSLMFANEKSVRGLTDGNAALPPVDDGDGRLANAEDEVGAGP